MNTENERARPLRQSGFYEVLQLARSQEKNAALDITGTASADVLARHMQGATLRLCISHTSFVKLLYTATDGYNNNHFSLFFELTQDVCQMMTLNFLCWKFHLKLDKYTGFQNNIVITIHMKSTISSNHTPKKKKSLKLQNNHWLPVQWKEKTAQYLFFSSASFQSSSHQAEIFAFNLRPSLFFFKTYCKVS